MHDIRFIPVAFSCFVRAAIIWLPAVFWTALPTCGAITNGLVAYWNFDQTNGAVAVDVSGTGKHGELHNFPTDNSVWTKGKIGGALRFGGPAAKQFIRVPNYPTNMVTVSAAGWVWADLRVEWGTIIKNWGGAIPGQFHFGLHEADGDLSSQFAFVDGTTFVLRERRSFPTNQWQHVAFVLDGKELRLFRNGEVVAVLEQPLALGRARVPGLGIGAKLDDSGNLPANPAGYWHGLMDDLALWCRALSPKEIRGIYRAGLAGHPLTSALPASLWWQGWWVCGVSVAMAVGAFAWAVRWVTLMGMRRRLALAGRRFAIERERLRIARDMHDDLGARLTKIALFAELASRNVQQQEMHVEHMDSVVQMCRDTAKSLDEMVWAVSPENDSLGDLVDYLCQYLYEYFEQTQIRVRLDLPQTIPIHRLDAGTRHELLLVFKEALNNIVKHAAAQEVLLQVKLEAGSLVVAVSDDGRGMPAPETPSVLNGNGLTNMRQRIESLGGILEIKHGPSQGTEVRMVIPLKTADLDSS